MKLKEVQRTAKENLEMVTRVENRLRQALDHRFCERVADDHDCSFKVVVKENYEKVNDINQIDTVVIYTGLMRYIGTDDELAYVMAHQLSHTLAQHLQKNFRTKMMNVATGYLLGAVLAGGIVAATTHPGSAFYVSPQDVEDIVQMGGLLGAAVGEHASSKDHPYSKDQENEADYIALYLIARAGYDPNAGKIFFNKLSQIKPSSDQEEGLLASDPANPERRVRIAKTIIEIKAKKAAGQPLYPEVSYKTPAQSYR